MHLFADDTFINKSALFNNEIIIYLAYFCKICVSLFAFTSGYGMVCKAKYSVYAGNTEQNFKQYILIAIKKLVHFLLLYWHVIVVVTIVGMIINQKFDLSALILNALGLSFSYCYTWRYVRYYFIMLIVIFPCVQMLFRILENKLQKKMRWFLYITVILLSVILSEFIATRYSLAGAFCILVFISGMFCARYEIMDKLINLHYTHKFYALSLLVSAFFIRMTYTNRAGQLTLDYICVPIFCSFYCILSNKLSSSNSVLAFFGKHSTYMWLLHAYILIYFKTVYPDYYYGLYTYIIVVLAALAIALIMEFLVKFENHLFEILGLCNID